MSKSSQLYYEYYREFGKMEQAEINNHLNKQYEDFTRHTRQNNKQNK